MTVEELIDRMTWGEFCEHLVILKDEAKECKRLKLRRRGR